jgi:integrase
VSLTPDIISKYRDQRLEAGRSANTVRLELALLSNLFTMALRDWRLGLTHNPVLLERTPSQPRGRDRRLQEGEEALLLSACDKHSNPMLGWIVRLALLTGMRLGEIASLRVSQVDLERRVVRLTETKNGTARTVPLPRAAVPILQAALDHPLRPGMEGRARKTRQSLRTVQIHVARMRRERWLEPVRYLGGGYGRATEYR